MRYLLTGASSGLGLSVLQALQFVEAHEGKDQGDLGPEIVAIGRDMKRLHWRLPAPFCVDVDMHDQAALADAVSELGPFNGIVHCAGREVVQPLRMSRLVHWTDAMMAAGAAHALLHAAACKGVMADGASIVLISSVAAHRGTAGMAAYSAGKASIEAMARCAAVELAPRGIRVNCVAPGAFRSPMHDRLTARMPQASSDAYAAKHPLGIGPVEAVRDAVLHLLSPAARWVTGSTVVVDGGYLA
jgi:NAD(P)-dependent dehydrogenase (short-subunit alcohol dehydrogenase family)